MAPMNHAHKLMRHKYKNGSLTYFCVRNCTFKIEPKLSVGLRVTCWRCGNEFSMNMYSIRRAKPCCDACVIPRNAEEKKEELFHATAVLTGQEVISELKDRLEHATVMDDEKDYL